ncbi:hypothetical protein RUND412_001836 [Rhizina undulata]
MSKFYFNSESDNDNDSDNPDSLPFPAPLSREAFTENIDAPFSPTEFLATLHHRHQTLEDLRAELRTRSRDLQKELVELVDRDYADFVGLGSSLQGGEGKVEDLKVGLMGFRREIEGVVGKIEGVRVEVERELRRKETVRKEKMLARNLLSLSQRLDELSSLLLLDEDPQKKSAPLPPLLDDGEGLTSLKRLRKLVAAYLFITQHLMRKLPPVEEHPFLRAQRPRMEKVRATILLDLGSALKEERAKEEEGKVLELMELFARLGAEGEAVKVFREGRKR